MGHTTFLSLLPLTQIGNPMNILKKPEQVTVPVNQPINFPTFHPIPDTGYVRRTGRACNSANYHRQPSPTHIQRTAAKSIGFIARQKQLFRQYCTDTWARLKQLGRDTVRWLTWRVVLPLSVLCAIWIPFANPAELAL